jgi:hypothetical protein
MKVKNKLGDVSENLSFTGGNSKKRFPEKCLDYDLNISVD